MSKSKRHNYTEREIIYWSWPVDNRKGLFLSSPTLVHSKGRYTVRYSRVVQGSPEGWNWSERRWVDGQLVEPEGSTSKSRGIYLCLGSEETHSRRRPPPGPTSVLRVPHGRFSVTPLKRRLPDASVKIGLKSVCVFSHREPKTYYGHRSWRGKQGKHSRGGTGVLPT